MSISSTYDSKGVEIKVWADGSVIYEAVRSGPTYVGSEGTLDFGPMGFPHWENGPATYDIHAGTVVYYLDGRVVPPQEYWSRLLRNKA